MKLIYDGFFKLNNALCDFWVRLSVFECDGKAGCSERCLELPDIVTGTFLIRYVSNCQLSSTYENISTTVLSGDVSVRHIALGYNIVSVLYIQKLVHCFNEIWAYNKAEYTTFAVWTSKLGIKWFIINQWVVRSLWFFFMVCIAR